jgi:multiple sugar transport system substrate-binding protein
MGRRWGASRRRVMAAAGAAGVLGACGTVLATSQAPAKALAPATLRYAAQFQPAIGTAYQSGLSRLVDGFNALGTPVKVTTEIPNPLYVAVLAQLAAGNPPDLMHAHPREYLPFINAGALLPLDTYFKQDKRSVADVVPTILDNWLRDGQHYAMPNNSTVQAIYFNKSMFDKQGLKTPDQYEKEGKWTFDVYLDLARKLTSGTGEQKVWGAPWLTPSLDIQVAFLWPMGGEMWDNALQNVLLAAPDSLDAIQFQADLSLKYGVSPTPEEEVQIARRIGGALIAERGGMEILTADVLGLLTATTYAKGMAPMPKGKGGRVIRGLPLGAHIMKASKAQDQAWEYLTYQTGIEAEKLMLGMHVTQPWHKSVYASPDFAKQLYPWENAAYYAESANKVRVAAYPNQFAAINTLYGNAFQAVRAGQKSARQAIAEMKPQSTELLRQR